MADLQVEIGRWIVAHQIAEAVEPVVEQGLVGGFAFAVVKGRFDLKQREIQQPAQFWDGDWFGVMLREKLHNSKHNLVLLKAVRLLWWLRWRGEVKQMTLSFALILLLPAAAFLPWAFSSVLRDALLPGLSLSAVVLKSCEILRSRSSPGDFTASASLGGQ